MSGVDGPMFPEVLEATVKVATAEGGNGVGSLDCPMHAGSFAPGAFR